MPGVVTDIKRFAIHDGPGIRTTVFLKGCPLRCAWCHNPESIPPAIEIAETTTMLDGRVFVRERTVGYEITSQDLLAEILKEYAFMDESEGGVTFSGGEPLMQYHFLVEMLQLCRINGIHTAVDTSLYGEWDRIKELLSTTDLFLVDLKIINDELHQKYTGVSNIRILKNLRLLSENNAQIRIRIPVVPGVNDSHLHMDETISFLRALANQAEQVDLLPFHNIAKEKYRRLNRENAFYNTPSMDRQDLLQYKQRFEQAGFIVTIGG